jgi:hypothetical protein
LLRSIWLSSCLYGSQEAPMHIHGNSSQLNAINPYAAAAEKATAEKRAANVSRKLMKKSASIDAASGLDEDSLLAQWMEGSSSQREQE